MTLKKQLIKFWTDALCCRFCDLPQKQRPQFRPVGKLYSPGGVVFCQINPAYIGGTTKSEIRSKFKLMRNKDIALRKLAMTQHLQGVQKAFLMSPSARTWDILCNEYFIMREFWGWPPGKYVKTIEEHGVELDSVSIVNLALCPVRNNAYKKLLKKCCEQRTFQLLKILQPRIIVAQGKTVFDYLEANLPPNGFKILQGVHHASRESSEKKQRLFNKVRIRLKKA